MSDFDDFATKNFLIYGKCFVHIDDLKKFYEEYRATNHALWMARAERAGAEANRCSVSRSHAHRVCSNNIRDYFNLKYKKWCWVERKCIEKAKEFE